LSWPWLAPRWRARRIRDEVYRRIRETDCPVVNEYLAGIDRLLRNAGMEISKGTTIESYLQRIPDLGFSLDPAELASTFNMQNYATTGSNQGIENYQRLFDAVYALGYGELSNRTRSQRV
ncbi:MAG: hypothetical protein ABW095_10100, partial [Candidatus Thiodiazotropha sp.]